MLIFPTQTLGVWASVSAQFNWFHCKWNTLPSGSFSGGLQDIAGRLPADCAGYFRCLLLLLLLLCAMRGDGHLAELPQLAAYGRKWTTAALSATRCYARVVQRGGRCIGRRRGGQHFRIAFKTVLLKAHLMCFRFVRSRVEIKKLQEWGEGCSLTNWNWSATSTSTSLAIGFAMENIIIYALPRSLVSTRLDTKNICRYTALTHLPSPIALICMWTENFKKIEFACPFVHPDDKLHTQIYYLYRVVLHVELV